MTIRVTGAFILTDINFRSTEAKHINKIEECNYLASRILIINYRYKWGFKL